MRCSTGEAQARAAEPAGWRTSARFSSRNAKRRTQGVGQHDGQHMREYLLPLSWRSSFHQSISSMIPRCAKPRSARVVSRRPWMGSGSDSAANGARQAQKQSFTRSSEASHAAATSFDLPTIPSRVQVDAPDGGGIYCRNSMASPPTISNTRRPPIRRDRPRGRVQLKDKVAVSGSARRQDYNAPARTPGQRNSSSRAKRLSRRYEERRIKVTDLDGFALQQRFATTRRAASRPQLGFHTKSGASMVWGGGGAGGGGLSGGGGPPGGRGAQGGGSGGAPASTNTWWCRELRRASRPPRQAGSGRPSPAHAAYAWPTGYSLPAHG